MTSTETTEGEFEYQGVVKSRPGFVPPIPTLEWLQRARDLLDKEGWASNAVAINIKNESCSPFSPEAEYFSIIGAYQRVLGRRGFDLLVMDALIEACPIPGMLCTWERLETTTYEDVLALYDRAIETTKSRA